MTDDRTQHVLDAIDGALDDWSVSGDAMRWTPEPKTAEGPPAPPGGSLRWQPTLVGASVEHRPGCSIVHEYLGAPPACQCGALDRAARRLQIPLSALRIAPAGTDPRDRDGWTDISRLVDGVGFRVTPWQGAVLAEMFGVAFRQAAEGMARIFAVSTEQVERMATLLAELDSSDPEPDPEPEDPRARALRLRQQRNTGPSRDVTRQRRPRRLPT